MATGDRIYLADKETLEKNIEAVSKLYGNAIIETVSGEIMTTTDSSDLELVGLKLYGKTTQVTTNGYQLFDASKVATKTAGGCTVTNNGDGSLTISGSGTLSETFSLSYDYTHEESVALLQEGTLHLAVGTTTPQVMVYLVRNSGTTVLDNSNTTAEITPEMLTDTTFFLRLSVYGASGSAIKTGTVKPMLYQDGDGTYEPFTGGKPSPSPEYPQELVSVGDGGAINTTVAGKNVVIPIVATTEISGLTVTVDDDGVVTANGTLTENTSVVVGKYRLPAYCRLRMYTGNAPLNTVYAVTRDNKGAVKGAYSSANWVSDVFRGAETEMSVTIVFTAATYTNYKARVIVAVDTDEWESYKPVQILTTHTLNGLPGIPVTSGGNYTDANGQQWICDEVDFARGVYAQRVKRKHFDGTEEWRWITESTNAFAMHVLEKYGTVVRNAVLCSLHKRTYIYGATTDIGVDMYPSAYGGDVFTLRVEAEMTSPSDVSAWIAEHPFGILYAVVAPIETPLSAEEIAAFKALHMNKPNTTVYNDSGAHMEMEYIADTKTYIDNKFTELQQAILSAGANV